MTFWLFIKHTVSVKTGKAYLYILYNVPQWIVLIIFFFHLLLPPTHDTLSTSATQWLVITDSSGLNFGNRGSTNLMKNEVYRTNLGEVHWGENIHPLQLCSHLASDNGITFISVKNMWRCAEAAFPFESLDYSQASTHYLPLQKESSIPLISTSGHPVYCQFQNNVTA